MRITNFDIRVRQARREFKVMEEAMTLGLFKFFNEWPGSSKRIFGETMLLKHSACVS